MRNSGSTNYGQQATSALPMHFNWPMQLPELVQQKPGNSILCCLQIIYIPILKYFCILLNLLIKLCTHYWRAGSSNIVRYWYYQICVIWWHGGIMVKNHAHWMSSPQSTFKNHVAFHTKSLSIPDTKHHQHGRMHPSMKECIQLAITTQTLEAKQLSEISTYLDSFMGNLQLSSKCDKTLVEFVQQYWQIWKTWKER